MSLVSERRRHRRLPWLVSVALLLGGGLAALTFLPAFEAAPVLARTSAIAEPAKPVGDDDDLNRIPDDVAMFATLNVAEAWDKEIVKTFLKQTADLKPLESLTQLLGVAPTEVQRITVISPAPSAFCVLVRTRKPIKPEAIQNALLPKAAKVPYKDKEYIALGQMALHFMPDNRTYVFGTLASVHRVATQPASDKGPLAAARTQASKHLIVAAVNFSDPEIRREVERTPKEVQQQYGHLLSARTGFAMIDLGAENRFQVTLQMANEADAKTALAEAKQLIALGVDTLGRFKKEQPEDFPPQSRAVFGQLESMLQKGQVTVTGTNVDVTLRADTALMEAVGPGVLIPAIQSIRQAAARTQQANKLKVIGIAYNNYLGTSNGKGPVKLEDLTPFLTVDKPEDQFFKELYAATLADVKSGAIVVNYGIGVARFNVEGATNIVLSYEKGVPTKGGQVGMADGSVRMMTAEEFKKATTPPKK